MISKIFRTISIVLVLMTLLLTIVTVYSISAQTREALFAAEQGNLVSIASTTASQINGDTFANIRPGDEGSPEFSVIRDQLRSVKASNADIRFIYTFRKSGDAVEFVVDGDFGYASDAASIGQVYPEPEDEILAAFTAPVADHEFTSDQWGTVLSGFAPIRDRQGYVVGIVGVDRDISKVKAQMDYLNLEFYVVGITLVFLAIIVLVIIERRRAADEQKISESEMKYRRLFEQARDCILLIDVEGENRGRILAANSAAAQMHGYTVEELLKMNVGDLDTPASREHVADRFSQLIRTGILSGEAMHKRKDGTEFPLEINSGLLAIGNKKYALTIDRDISERKQAEHALQHASSKLSFLNAVTFNDIQNAVYILTGFLTLAKLSPDLENMKKTVEKIEGPVRTITRSLDFARSYQDLGVKPPVWQNVNQVFILAISHLDFSAIRREVRLDSLEIYADPLLERVFFSLALNVITHGETATLVKLDYTISGDNLVIVFEDNGKGIPVDFKQKIFERGYGLQKNFGLFLVQQILSITGITIAETGVPASGARFEITVPKGAWRFSESR
jgi:PAS domain S-box-containing protein